MGSFLYYGSSGSKNFQTSWSNIRKGFNWYTIHTKFSSITWTFPENQTTQDLTILRQFHTQCLIPEHLNGDKHELKIHQRNRHPSKVNPRSALIYRDLRL